MLLCKKTFLSGINVLKTTIVKNKFEANAEKQVFFAVIGRCGM